MFIQVIFAAFAGVLRQLASTCFMLDTLITMPRADVLCDNITVLIPAAGRVPEGVLGGVSHISCTALIPVARRPVIYWTVTYLRRLGLRRFRVAVPQRGLFVEDLFDCLPDRQPDYDFIVPNTGPDGGPGDTVLSLLDTVKTPSALIVLGDTHFQFADPTVLQSTTPFVLTSPVNESYRWCVAEKTAEGYIARLRDKVPNLPPPLDGLIGVYFFPDVELARSATRDAFAAAHQKGKRLELAEILEEINRRTPVRVLPAGEWLDVGNPDRQADSQVSLLQKREFNDLAIDGVLGTITKRSRNQAKFRDEINYLRLLPPELSVLFPRLLDFELDWDKLSMTMEYYGYPSLAEVFLYHQLDPAIWERVFSHLYDIVKTAFLRYRQPIARELIVDMYLGKTRKRLKDLSGDADLRAIRDHKTPLIINGEACQPIDALWPMIERDVNNLAANATGSVIHGDLCFSNILYDLRSQICKFVDPRGSFGEVGIFGDSRYDVAKLYHSVFGLYDFITNDLFQIHVDGDKVQLDIRTRPQYKQILERFDKVFFAPGRFDRREILLITGLIFLAIPALHYDSPPRQLAMYLRAMQIFGELYPPTPPTPPSAAAVEGAAA
jgi:dTDP-glucose pyrophosphorylase